MTTPYPLMAGRASFRDLAESQIDPNINNYVNVGTLINDLRNILNPIDPATSNNIIFPGFTTSLGAKYNAYGSAHADGTPALESEQIAVEMMTFVDSCLNTTVPGYAYHTPLAGRGISAYGLGEPMAGTPAAKMITSPSLTRRRGTSGQFLINEIALQADAVAYQSNLIYQWWINYGQLPPLTPTVPPTNPPTSPVGTSTVTPKLMTTGLGGQTFPLLFLMLRQPADYTPLDKPPGPNQDSPDRFIVIRPQAEMMTPSHWGFVQPGANGMNPEGVLLNTEIDVSTDSTNGTNGTWSTYNFDVCGNLKSGGVAGGAPADNPCVPSATLIGYQERGITSILKADPGNIPAIQPNGDTYAAMDTISAIYLVIGPFAPHTTPSLKIKPRFIFYNDTDANHNALWDNIPGIFPDFPSGVCPGGSPSGQPGADGTYTTPDPNDASPPTAASTAIINTFLEFDFPLFDVDSITDTWVSYEATDPRVTGRKSDWKLCTNGARNTLSPPGPNTTQPSSIDTSKLARPPAFLQTLRGTVRGETQTASRILGLPGVGYLSEVPTKVDSGKSWSTLKFHAIGNDTPVDQPPPDWLLWNLFYVPFDRSMSNQTDGKLNINAKLYPFKAADGVTDLVREKPLEALLGNRVANPTTLATAIALGPTYKNGGALPSDLYVYSGQICEVPGFADATTGINEYDQEYLSRDLADIVTTQSSDYRVFVVAQTLKQSSTGQITPVTTQRIETTLSRVVDAGKPGYAFSMLDAGPNGSAVGSQQPYPFYVYLRNAYRPTANGPPNPAATRTEVEIKAAQANGPPINDNIAVSPLGLDHIPNTADDWLIPQKIEISSYKIIK
jgi:hypothetical protein